MIPYATQWIEEDDIAAVAGVMRGTHLTQGPAIEKFEKALAQYLGVRHVIAVSSGTAALHLAVLALGGGPNIRGFVPPITFAATLNCFWYTGSKATLVDVDPLTGQMTPETLEATLANTPRAQGEQWIVIPVSLQGRPLNYAGLKKIADDHDAILIEDAAHGMGGYYYASGDKNMIGSCAHTLAAITSFHSVKQLCLGEGGAVMTNDDALAAKVKLLRSHGIVRPGRKTDPAWYYEQTDLGFHYRITDIQCALGLSQLKKLDARHARRQELAKRYDEAFLQEPFAGTISFAKNVEGHAYHLYPIRFADETARNAAHEFLKTKGFLTQVHYVPLNRFPYHKVRLGDVKLPGADAYYRGTLSIPLFAKMTDEQQEQVISALKEFCMGLKMGFSDAKVSVRQIKAPPKHRQARAR